MHSTYLKLCLFKTNKSKRIASKWREHLVLDRKKQHYHYNGIPMSDVLITVVEWRSTVKNVLKVNDAELNIIESLLIQGEHLKYADTAKTFLITFEEEQQEYLVDDRSGTAFNNWLNTPREFVFC